MQPIVKSSIEKHLLILLAVGDLRTDGIGRGMEAEVSIPIRVIPPHSLHQFIRLTQVIIARFLRGFGALHIAIFEFPKNRVGQTFSIKGDGAGDVFTVNIAPLGPEGDIRGFIKRVAFIFRGNTGVSG